MRVPIDHGSLRVPFSAGPGGDVAVVVLGRVDDDGVVVALDHDVQIVADGGRAADGRAAGRPTRAGIGGGDAAGLALE